VQFVPIHRVARHGHASITEVFEMCLVLPAPFPQSGVIPYRWQDQQLEVLLITSRRGARWIIPKGMVEPQLSPAASACQEAYEEAGVRGRVSSVAIGSYQYRKWGMRWTVEVFTLAVQTTLEVWPEMRERERRWFPVQVAAQAVTELALQSLISSLPNALPHP
jgi:8-oxo-dGTP pyrophosphatase MutT (NUDIX family)